MPIPSLEEIDRIAQQGEPIIRNLQITQCYYEISQSVGDWLGFSANWCTFATWASKQAGQTIRQEDLLRAFEERFHLSPEIAALLETLDGDLESLREKIAARLPPQTTLQLLNPAAPLARAAVVVARGKQKVFQEIGREFARFLVLFHGDTELDSAKIKRFCDALRPGEPPDGQRLLRQVFATYCAARFTVNADRKAELVLLANLCVGFHEQIRLQPEIAEALNAALGNPQALTQKLVAALVPELDRSSRLQRRLSRQASKFDSVFARLSSAANRLLREIITEQLMTLHLPGAEVLRR